MLALTDAGVGNRCVVCKAKRKGNYLGIEVCRACAVFFRRANINGTVLKCRSGTDDCKLDRDSIWLCKKCRYNRISLVCHQLMLREKQCQSGPSNSLEWNYDAIPEKENFTFYLDEIGPINVSPMLNNFRRCYNDLCRERLIMDFGSLNNLPFNEYGVIEEEATDSDCKSVRLVRRLHEQISGFLSSVSEEYAVMTSEHQLKLFANFIRMFIPFECAYRSIKYFSQYDNRAYATFGRYMDVFNIARYFEDIIPENVFKKDALRMLQEVVTRNYSEGKPALTRLHLSDEEYIGITSLLLWNITMKNVPDALSEVARKNKTAVLHDLYKYYRSVGLENYSARLGEVFMFLSLLETLVEASSRLIEVFKVFGIIDDEMYALAKLTIE